MVSTDNRLCGSDIGNRPHLQPQGGPLRPHSTPATLMWLEENYEMAEGVCIPRNTLYQHYVDFCDAHSLMPVNAASFGKIIRQQFPGLTTRRLGTRGQSRYHYYGIAIREGSKYFEVGYSRKGNAGTAGNHNHDIKKDSLKHMSFLSVRGKTSTTAVLEFPSLKEFSLPPHIDSEKLATFLMMYRTHCQRLFDAILRANFDEIQNLLLHFWRSIPPHLTFLLSSNTLANLVGICDSILYRTVCRVLMPSILQAIPDNMSQVIRKFTHDLSMWINKTLENQPSTLKQIKIDLARRFSRMLRRQASLNHLCQAARMVLHSPEITQQMVQDWRQLDLNSVARQASFYSEKSGNNSISFIKELYREFERLLEDNAPLEVYSEWLESMVERCLSRRGRTPLHKVAYSFLLTWSCFATRVIKDMTLHSAPSFGSFHLLHLMFDDYLLYLVESMHTDDRARCLFSNIATDTPPDFSSSDHVFGEINAEGTVAGLAFHSEAPVEENVHSSSNTNPKTENSVTISSGVLAENTMEETGIEFVSSSTPTNVSLPNSTATLPPLPAPPSCGSVPYPSPSRTDFYTFDYRMQHHGGGIHSRNSGFPAAGNQYCSNAGINISNNDGLGDERVDSTISPGNGSTTSNVTDYTGNGGGEAFAECSTAYYQDQSLLYSNSYYQQQAAQYDSTYYSFRFLSKY